MHLGAFEWKTRCHDLDVTAYQYLKTKENSPTYPVNGFTKEVPQGLTAADMFKLAYVLTESSPTNVSIHSFVLQAERASCRHNEKCSVLTNVHMLKQ